MDTVKLDAPMPEGKKCPQCGTPLPAGALAGLCPACLLKVGAAADTVTEGRQPPFTPPSVAQLGPLFPQLEILELIGKGGMGAVYKARQRQLDRVVALKILPPGIGNDPAFAERFAREAKALAKLNHPGIVTIYDFGRANGLFYFFMEFVDGVNLRQLLHAGRMSPREALAIVPQICDALQFAHDQGIVHRDIKPENILLDRRGRVKVADFGLAKIVGTDTPLTPSLSPSDGERVAKPGEGNPALTDAGKVMGTPQYMSPEQITAPGEVDHRADIYALGVVFYQMLTGELPGKTIEPPSHKVQIDVRLDEIVLRALEKNPALRYQQVSEVKTCVETIAGSSRHKSAQIESASDQKGRSGFTPAVTSSFKRGLVQFATFGSAMLLACLVILLAMSSDSIGGKTWSYFRLCFEILAAAVFAGFLFIIQRAVKTQTAEAWRDVKSWLPMMIVMTAGILFGFWSPHLLKPKAGEDKSFYIGQTSFPLGDSIEITSVERSDNQMTVKGRYNLVSADRAQLALFITSSSTNHTPVDSRQWTNISRGGGNFELTHPHLCPGLPHVTMYSTNGHGFAGVYFGNKAEAADESKSDWIHYQTPDELTQEGWQLWQTRKFADAETKFQQAVQLAPADANAWNGLGWAQFNSGKNNYEARKSFLKALALEPNHPAALNGMGQIHLSEGKHDGAEKFLLKAAPQSPAAWFGLARLYLLEGKFEQAEKWAQNIVDSGQADEVAKKMLEAAKAKHLSEGLRLMIEPPASKNQSNASTTAQPGSFGPVIERVGNDGADGFGREMYLDLDTSRLMSYPKDQHFSDSHLGQQWLATNGLDLQTINQVRAWTNGIAEAADKIFFDMSGQHLPAGPLKGIFISDSAVLRLDNAQWNSLVTDALTTALAPQPSSAIGYYSAAGELPVTLGFKTREGGRGILQVTGFTENPRGVKIRYKLVQNGGHVKSSPMTAAQDWLALMDSGAYPKSWETAAESFHQATTKAAWVKLSEEVRQTLGQLISRKEISAQPSTIVPGMPRGSYFVAQFETSFSALTNAVETVEFSLEKDGQWKAIRYLIRPRTAEQTAAVMAAQKWLAGIDAGHYAESWTDASEFFRNALSQDKWVQALESVRSPLGKLEIRTVDSAVTETTLPGAPYGGYIVMQFHTSFANINRVTETVTFSPEKDGQWRASGYTIK